MDNDIAGCQDNSDEGAHCANWDCLLNSEHQYWKCADNLQCIRAFYVCDGRPHFPGAVGYTYGCRDKSDEHNQLCGYCTGDNEWPCQDGDGCAHAAQVCDGNSHCNDGSDEYKDVCLVWNCTHGMWKCRDNVLCIPLSSICDGEIRCIDSSDEQGCRAYTCLEDSRKCASNEECVEIQAVCDGQIDCQDASDEMCSASCLESPLDVSTIVRTCTEDSTRCFPVERYCDRMADCPLGSDESDAYCSCEDWNMYTCYIGGSALCIYKEWISMEHGQLCDMDVILLDGRERNPKQFNISG